MDLDKIAREWDKRGFSCDVWVDPPGKEWVDFVHDQDEVVMLIKGDVEFEFEGKVIRPRRGEEVLIPGGVKHTARNIGTTNSRWLYGYKRA